MNKRKKWVFVLPKSVLQVCRTYLWTGQAFYSRPGNGNWEEVCKPKLNGGLGFRQVQLWNIASMGRHVWAIAKKKDNLWIKWVSSVCIKHTDWWSYRAPNDCCWY